MIAIIEPTSLLLGRFKRTCMERSIEMTEAIKGGKGLNLNDANAEDLDRIGGMGKQRSQDIVNYRDQHGPFKSWDDVKKIPGFGDKLIQDMQDQGIRIE